MNATFKVFVLGFAVLFFGVYSCSKDGETGPMGQQGAKGDQGDQGVPGEQGPPGEQGDPGTANVIYSDLIVVPGSDWSGLGTPMITYSFSPPDLTQEIADSGLLLVYMDYLGKIRPLPYLFPSGLHIGYVYDETQVSLEAFFVGGGSIAAIVSLEFRYIIIPGGIPSSGKGGPDFGNMSYEEVMDYFGKDH